MTELDNEIIKKSIVELRKLREEVAELKQQKCEPIAIVGMGCTLPGNVSTPEEYWNFISNKGDGITDPPKGRWNLTNIADINYSEGFFRGGYIESDCTQFDPLFFDIPPKEANYMDPQHRLFLEDTWRALENAGIDPKSLSGSLTGVFCGITATEYLQMMLNELPEEELNAYMTTGNCLNFAAGRVSYVLGLKGPSLAIDTACSSSLVAVHSACQSLRNRECNAAIAGGVSLALAPQTYLLLKNGNMLASDGRSKTFDESADGYGRGEGSGVVILKRLSDALEAKDRIYAVIKNTEVQHDGKKSGLTVPLSSAQKALITETLSKTDLEPGDVSFCEAHGTGTSLGDPIELEALEAIYGKSRDAGDKLHISSVKANIGHLEASAGIAGLMKAALAIYNEKIPPHIGVNKLNSHFDWDNSSIKVELDGCDWPENKKRVATVSSFGASGTNAHAILEQADAEVSEETQARIAEFSGKTVFKKQPCWYKKFDARIFEDAEGDDYRFHDAVYRFPLHIDSAPTIREHRIFGSVVLTGSIYLDIALTVTTELTGKKIGEICFGNVTLLRPIVFENETVDLCVTIEKLELANQEKSYRIKMYPNGSDITCIDNMYSSVDILEVQATPEPVASDFVKSAIASCTDEYDKEGFYGGFWGSEFALGEPFHIYDKVWRKDGKTAVGYCRPQDFVARTNAYNLTPESIVAYLTGLLFKGALPHERMLELEKEGKTFIGTGYDSCHFYSSLITEELYAVADIRKISEDGTVFNGEVTMLDAEGNVLCKMTNIAFTEIEKDSVPAVGIPTSETAPKHVDGKAHPVLGDKFTYIKDWCYQTELDYQTYPLIGDHLTFDFALFPAVGYIDLAVRAIKKISPDYRFTKIDNLKVAQPIMLHKGDKYKIKTVVDKKDDGDFIYNIEAYSDKKNVINKEWGLSSGAEVTDKVQIPENETTFDPKIVETFDKEYNTQEFFDEFWGDDFILGNSYQFMEKAWRKEFEAVGVIRDFDNHQKRIGISDIPGGFLQIYMSLPLAMATIPDEQIAKANADEATCIAVLVKRFVIYDDNNMENYEELWAHAKLANKEELDTKWISDFDFYNKDGKLVARVLGVEFHIMKKKALELLKESMEDVETEKPNDSVEVVSILKSEMSRIIGTDIDALDKDTHLGQLMDSIMALELRGVIEKKLAILLPLNNISESKSISELAEEVVNRSNGLLKL